MTDRYYVERKAEDLKMGDMFVHWAVIKDGLYKESLYPKPQRILNIIVARDRTIAIHLADLSTRQLHEGQIVIVEELA